MDIQEQFNLIAKEYDSKRRCFIPCFTDFYEGATSLIASMVSPTNIVDLGAGTGLLSYYWYKHFPRARYTLVDISTDMLEVAKRRFCGMDNVGFLDCDYEASLPDIKVDAVISALSIHHLEDSSKEELFCRIYNALSAGGVFVNYDQFCQKDARINEAVNSYWEDGIAKSSLTQKDIALWRGRQTLDRECSIEDELKMLYRSHFPSPTCLYSNLKFAVLIATK